MVTLTTFSRRLNARRRRHSRLPALVLMTDALRLPEPLRVAARLPRGSAVILRDYAHAERAALAEALAAVCRRQGSRLLVAGDGRLAAAVRAAGLHVGERHLAEARRWRRRRPDWLISAAAHSVRGLRRARAAGVDFAVLSPVFATRSHPGAPGLGALRLAAMARRAPLPVVALGGIDAVTVARLAGCRIAGIAAIDGLAREFAEEVGHADC